MRTDGARLGGAVLSIAAPLAIAGTAAWMPAAPAAARTAHAEPTLSFAPGGVLTDVSAASPRNAWAVGQIGTTSVKPLIARWNGTAWTVARNPLLRVTRGWTAWLLSPLATRGRSAMPWPRRQPSGDLALERHGLEANARTGPWDRPFPLRRRGDFSERRMGGRLNGRLEDCHRACATRARERGCCVGRRPRSIVLLRGR
jgi:hypothetical protein